MLQTTKLILIRHGESLWNEQNRFTGWCDIDLSDKGRKQAIDAGFLLQKKGFIFDFAYTSMLKRAIHTLWYILDVLDQAWLPVEKSWRLNERHYGALQGLNKNETISKYGFDQVQQWRRSVNISPPPSINNDSFIQDMRYSCIPEDVFPCSESLALTINRIKPLWIHNIINRIKNHERVMIVSHGNSIRSIIQLLSNLNNKELFDLNIPTASPIVYEFDHLSNPIGYFYLTNH